MKFKLHCFILLLLSALAASAQGFKAPAPEKAAIYFCRVSSLGFAIPFEFFHDKAYIGDFAGKNYMRYECDPGQHLFWASSENKEFLTAEVEAGKSYIVIVDVEMGIGIARVGLTPISASDAVLERAKKLINKKAPVTTTQEELDRKNTKLVDFIREKLQRYEEKWKTEKKFKHLSPDMALPAQSM